MNKKSKKNQENEIYKKKLKTVIITYIIFAIVIITLTFFKKYSVIDSDFSLIFIYIIIAMIFLLTIVLLCAKSFSSKEINTSLCINIIGIALLIIFAIAIDVRKELIDFSKNATKTEALVYKEVEKDIDYHKERCTVGREKGNYCYVGDSKHSKEPAYYDVEFIYYLKYNVEDEIYTSTYKKQEGGKFSSEQMANSWESKYKKGDYITIYYDNGNPEEVRENFASGFGMVYFFEVIALLFQFYYFNKHKKLMNEVV